MKIYHVETQQAYDELMSELEVKGYEWHSGYKPTYSNYWSEDKEDTCIEISGKKLTFGTIKWYKKKHSNIPIIEYKAKGENMLNTECKQCHNKCHQGNVKYCSMCGKKLVYEPKFKAGDIVSSEILPDGCGIVRLEEDLTNELSEVYGIWYTNYDCEIQESDFVVFKEDTRHATPEEIAEYESALSFHEHGRKPFEVKDGDLLENKFGRYIANGYSFSKEDFIVGSNAFLKTAEEVNEWL